MRACISCVAALGINKRLFIVYLTRKLQFEDNVSWKFCLLTTEITSCHWFEPAFHSIHYHCRVFNASRWCYENPSAAACLLRVTNSHTKNLKKIMRSLLRRISSMRSLVKRHCVFLITKSSLSVLMRSLFYEENFLVKRYPVHTNHLSMNA